jgi:hypothetical protein
MILDRTLRSPIQETSPISIPHLRELRFLQIQDAARSDRFYNETGGLTGEKIGQNNEATHPIETSSDGFSGRTGLVKTRSSRKAGRTWTEMDLLIAAGRIFEGPDS